MTNSQATRVAIAGCGAVASTYYARALTSLKRNGRIETVGAFDPDDAKAVKFTQIVGGGTVTATFAELLRCGADLMIVASPPGAHAYQVVEALEAGIDVLCEKPLAIGADEARRMISTAERMGRKLFAGHVRRQFAVTKAIHGLIASGSLGDIRSVSCFEGGPFAWPVHGPSYFSRSASGGGVLQDIGTHCIDLMCWWFGMPANIQYQDDAIGGVEANCLVTLDYQGFRAKIRLSRDWARPNIYRIEGTNGWLEWQVDDLTSFDFGFMDGLDGTRIAMRLNIGADLTGDDFHLAFERQISAALDAGRGADNGAVTAEMVLPTIELIESCYANRTQMCLPWLSEDEARRAMQLAGVRQ
ncbi:MAG TPA: Gfo/Idh/MocA family oxidoreductase [Thermohalobaculum sp.]|nr:Gfo/Idh/MocA family oxidoreductase [Thermohalobaculum sp.]